MARIQSCCLERLLDLLVFITQELSSIVFHFFVLREIKRDIIKDKKSFLQTLIESNQSSERTTEVIQKVKMGSTKYVRFCFV